MTAHSQWDMHPKYKKDYRWYQWTYLQVSSGDTDREQNCGHSGGRRDELREQHGNIYITVCKIEPLGICCTMQGAHIRCSVTTYRLGWVSSPKLMSIESVMPSSHLILCRPLLWQRPIQYCKAIIHPWNINFKKQQQSNCFQ